MNGSEQEKTPSAERLMDGVDKSLTTYLRCLIRYWLWDITGRPITGSDVEVCLDLITAARKGL